MPAKRHQRVSGERAERLEPADGAGDQALMRGFPVPTEQRIRARDVYRTSASTRWFMQHVRHVLGTADLLGSAERRDVYPLPRELRDLDGLRIAEDGTESDTLAAVLQATDTDGFLVLHRGAIVYETYFHGMTAETPHMWQSVSKSLVSCVAGNLVAQRRLEPDERVAVYVPELTKSAYGDALVRQLLDMQVGIDYSEDYRDPDAQVNELDRLYGVRPARSRRHPGSTYDYATRLSKRGEHGVDFDYVSLNVNVLAWVMERATGRWLPELVRSEVWRKLGGEHDAYLSLDVAGSVQAESGVCSSLRDMARLGLALSHEGRLNARQVVPTAWVGEIMQGGDREAFARHEEAGILPNGSYKDYFWIARSGGRVAFMGLGIYGQMLYVNPAADLVVAKFSTQPAADDMKCFRLEFELAERLAETL